MKNLKIKINIFFDYLKDFIIFIILAFLIIVFLSIVLHNTIKILQLSEKYSGEYKNLVKLENGDVVNVYTVGEGEKTIVILPGYGIQSPVIMYKNLTERLKTRYKVVVIEYPGYGFAQNTDLKRTNENIVNDIKGALETAQINGPYIFMPHSISNIYVMKFVQMYPDLVESVVALDGQYPAEINEKVGKKNIQNTTENVKIISVLEYTGIARFLSYIKPDMYYIDLLKKDEYIKESDIKLYRKMIATNYLTDTMVDEIKNVENNMKELKDFKYSESLPVLQILSSEMIEEHEKQYSKNKLIEFAQNTITNVDIQQITVIDGKHMIHLSNFDEVVSEIGRFMNR